MHEVLNSYPEDNEPFQHLINRKFGPTLIPELLGADSSRLQTTNENISETQVRHQFNTNYHAYSCGQVVKIKPVDFSNTTACQFSKNAL